MRFNSKQFALSLIVFLVSWNMQAQKGGDDPAGRAAKMTQVMTDSLILSTAQTSKVNEINLDYSNKMSEARKAARESENPDRESMQATMKTLREERKAALKNILTADQFAKFEQMDVANEARRREKGASQNSRKEKKEKPGKNG